MKARLLSPHQRYVGRDDRGRHITEQVPAGFEIEDPEAYLLVLQGAAEPGDDECALAAKQTPEERDAARLHYEMARKGIAPEDFDAYRAGAMIGYDPEGNWLPGPNFDAWQAAQAEPEEEA